MQPACRRADVPLGAGDLAGEEKGIPVVPLQRRPQQSRAVDERIAVHLAEADKLGARQARDHPQHALLVAPFDVGLEADQVVEGACDVVLAELHHGERTPAGAGIAQTYRRHRSEGQRLRIAASQHLNRQARFKIASRRLVSFELMQAGLFRRAHRLHEREVLVTGERAVDVVATGIRSQGSGVSPQALALRRTVLIPDPRSLIPDSSPLVPVL